MIEGKDFDVLDDGAIRYHDGGVVEPQAEDETPLRDALGLSPEIALPRIHSPAIAAILAAPDTPEHNEKRQARLAAINRLMAENSAPQADSAPTSEQESESEEESK